MIHLVLFVFSCQYVLVEEVPISVSSGGMSAYFTRADDYLFVLLVVFLPFWRSPSRRQSRLGVSLFHELVGSKE